MHLGRVEVSFDLGEIDPSIQGMMSKAHLAINAALFRPFIWEAKNPVMILSALENSYFLFLTLFLLVKLKFFGVFKLIFNNPFLLFSMLFSLFFAFSVGISTPNFGALVRLRIPCIPFFLSSLFILKHLYELNSQHIRIKNRF